MNFKNYHVWSRDCHRVPNLLLCTKFHRNWIIFRPDMAISRFSRWRISAISNFRRSNNGFFEKPTKRTSYRSSIKTIALNCLVFEKIAFFCILATNRQTDKQTDEQLDSTDALSRSRCCERRLNKHEKHKT